MARSMTSSSWEPGPAEPARQASWRVRAFDVLLLDKSGVASRHRPQRRTDASGGLLARPAGLRRRRCSPRPEAASRPAISTSTVATSADGPLSGRHALSRFRAPGRAPPVRRNHARPCRREGARFEAGPRFAAWSMGGRVVRVLAEVDSQGGGAIAARIVIGADGASSAVSRSIGNNLKDGVLGLSVRTTYAGCEVRRRNPRLFQPRLFSELRLDVHRRASDRLRRHRLRGRSEVPAGRQSGPGAAPVHRDGPEG